jgi:hypothetical protein
MMALCQVRLANPCTRLESAEIKTSIKSLLTLYVEHHSNLALALLFFLPRE